MRAKIVRAFGDVGVPPFWLDVDHTDACPGEGGLSSKRHPFLGNTVDVAHLYLGHDLGWPGQVKFRC